MTPERILPQVRKYISGMEFDLPDGQGKMVLVRRQNEDVVYRILPKKQGDKQFKFDLNPSIESLELCADAANERFPNADLTNTLNAIVESRKPQAK